MRALWLLTMAAFYLQTFAVFLTGRGQFSKGELLCVAKIRDKSFRFASPQAILQVTLHRLQPEGFCSQARSPSVQQAASAGFRHFEVRSLCLHLSVLLTIMPQYGDGCCHALLD